MLSIMEWVIQDTWSKLPDDGQGGTQRDHRSEASNPERLQAKASNSLGQPVHNLPGPEPEWKVQRRC